MTLAYPLASESYFRAGGAIGASRTVRAAAGRFRWRGDRADELARRERSLGALLGGAHWDWPSRSLVPLGPERPS
jgi:hypothetical protein